MKTYSAMWESGGYVFQNKPAAQLFELLPPGFRPLGIKSRLKTLKDIPHDVFENHIGRKLIVMEDVFES